MDTKAIAKILTRLLEQELDVDLDLSPPRRCDDDTFNCGSLIFDHTATYCKHCGAQLPRMRVTKGHVVIARLLNRAIKEHQNSGI